MKHPPPGLAHLRDDLAALQRADLLRDDAPRLREGVSFSSNDYLGLAERGVVQGRAGAGASRLVDGDRPDHRALERALGEWLQVEGVLLFTSGYAANVGILSALVRPGDLVVSDELNHASLIDGIRLSRGVVRIVPHLDLGAVQRSLEEPRSGRAWVVTESYFSMDADSPDLRALRGLCDRHGAALIVDEAHAIGALGPQGRGLCADAGVTPDVLVGTLGKALGAQGAFVAGCAELRAWLWNRSRSFVFSTGMSPAVASAALRNLGEIRDRPELREALAERAAGLRKGLEARGLRPAGHGHIVPWILGEPAVAVEVANRLRELGIPAQPIRPPSVPAGTSRIRITASATHTPADLARFFDALDAVLPCLPSSTL